MIKRITRKIWVSYFAPLSFLASLREIKEVDLKETAKKIVIPAFVTPVKLRCVAIRSSAVLLFCLFTFEFLLSQQKSYCNPINIDYGYTPIPNFTE